jgi:SHS2 domain-containing protein
MFNIITDHTADIGLKERAKNLKLLFKKCAIKIVKLSLKKSKNRGELKKLNILLKNKTISYEDLLHDFLNEIIYFIFVKKIYPVKINIENISENKIKALIFYRKINENEIIRELKSVTYHNLKIKKKNTGFLAEMIIDT